MLLNGPVKPRLPAFFKEALNDLHVLFYYESHIKPIGTPFNLIISFLFSFILTSIKENFLVYSQHHLLRRLRVAT